MQPKQPNIILILSDQHRGDWLRTAGCPWVRTPHLDSLAKRGTRFETAYCNYPLCGPSRMSLLTGRHPHRLGVYINEQCLSSDTPTFAHALGLAGYETVLAGRMHFMGPDQRHGFNHRLVGDICRCYAGGPDHDYGDLAGTASSTLTAVTRAGPGDSPVLQYDLAVTEAAEGYLRGYEGDKPLFLTVGWYGPHHPYTAPPELYRQARGRMEGKDQPWPIPPGAHPFLHLHRRKMKTEHFTAQQVAEARGNYAGMIERTDALVGRVLQAAEGLKGETLIVYTSDHGESAGDLGLWGKGHLYEGALRVPLIVAGLKNGMGEISKGAVVSTAVSLLDVCPTLVELGGGTALPLQDGQSLAGAVQGRTMPTDRPVWAEMEMVFLTPIFEPVRMVRRGDWKLIYYHRMEPAVELYNLAEDPEEQQNLANDARWAEVRAELSKLVLEGWDAERLRADALAKGQDLKAMWAWGQKIGLGAMDLWIGPKGCP